MNLNNLFEKILKDGLLQSVFQPIVSLEQQSIYAYEALIRGPQDTPLHNPLDLFDFANEIQQAAKLEFACRKQSIKQYAGLNLPLRLFLNISPSVLIQPGFKKGKTLAALEEYGLSPSNITIEITENHPTNNYALLKEAVNHYRKMGFRIAMDDLGAGYSGLRLWSEVLPDYVKVDRHFIANIDTDRVKYNFVKSLQNMTKITNCRIIAEGVETREEFEAIRSLGISFAQGFYFEKPNENPSRMIPVHIFASTNIDPAKGSKNQLTIDSILRKVTSISPHITNRDVLKFLQDNPKVIMVPVVGDKTIHGLLYKDQFLTKLFASPYGLDLHGDKKLVDFIDCSSLLFESNLSVQSVSNQLTNSDKDYQAFIITKNSLYAGIATVIELLEVITEQQLQSAKHANPLTELPGIIPINQSINELLNNDSAFSVAYIDLDHFKPYNDVYGFQKGDLVIKSLAESLNQVFNSKDGIIGHIGGDDFIGIIYHDCPSKLSHRLLDVFEQHVSSFYNKADSQASGISGKDRDGNPKFFPLISLSVGAVDFSCLSHCNSHLEVADLLTEAKISAKNIKGNSLFVKTKRKLRNLA